MQDLASRPTGWGGPTVEPPTVAEVEAAAERIREVVVHTPLIPFYSGKEKTGILLKPEIFQPIGSFKLRGVFNWAAALTPAERQRGLSTISSGNTAQALGLLGPAFRRPRPHPATRHGAGRQDRGPPELRRRYGPGAVRRSHGLPAWRPAGSRSRTALSARLTTRG